MMLCRSVGRRRREQPRAGKRKAGKGRRERETFRFHSSLSQRKSILWVSANIPIVSESDIIHTYVYLSPHIVREIRDLGLIRYGHGFSVRTSGLEYHSKLLFVRRFCYCLFCFKFKVFCVALCIWNFTSNMSCAYKCLTNLFPFLVFACQSHQSDQQTQISSSEGTIFSNGSKQLKGTHSVINVWFISAYIYLYIHFEYQ